MSCHIIYFLPVAKCILDVNIEQPGSAEPHPTSKPGIKHVNSVLPGKTRQLFLVTSVTRIIKN